MERAFRQRRQPYAASFYKSRAVFFGAVLFFVSQVLQLIQLLQTAGERSAAGQSPPEDFTPAAIVRRALMIGLTLMAALLLRRHQSGALRLGRRKLHLLACALLTIWAAVRLVDTVVEILIYPQFILILDCATVCVCVIAPILILLLADFEVFVPDDNILLFLGIGGIGFAVISLVIIGVVLRVSYTFWRLLPELLFRLGLILFGVATLQKALKLRASYPLTEPVDEPRAEPPRKQKKYARADEPFSLRLENEPEPPPARAATARTPRPPQEDSPRASQTARTPRPQSDQSMWQTGRIIVQGGTGRLPTQDPGAVPAERQTCPYCGKRMPLGFPNCPRCGRSM